MPLSGLLPPDSERVLAAVAVAAGYVGFCGRVVRGQLRRRREALPPTAGSTVPVLVVHASQTGFAEAIARQTADTLEAAGVAARLLPISALDAPLLAAAERALFIVSTTGEGDAPDAAAGFARRVLSTDPDLPRLRYGLLALGDRSYKRFCAFGMAVDGWLARQGAAPLFPSIEVHDGDAGALERWGAALARLGADGAIPERWGDQALFTPWRLAERRQLNPGNVDHPAFHLALTPLDGALEWQAGDLARVAIGDPDRPGDLPHRDYSIASIPGDGSLDLLVRQAKHADGSLGLGSGWLTRHLVPGDRIAVQVRRNPGFHAPADDRPLILIGNGTGLAGLRAHLKARATAGLGGNWLLFGERARAHDFFHRAEIEEWQQGGIIARLDLAFSRDQEERIYVQHRLRAAAADLSRWVADGAAILVCGSADGMAPGVARVLADVLGGETLERLAEEGRYRHDVY